MLRRRLVDQGDLIMWPQRSVRISLNPNGTHDVFLLSTLGVVTCNRFIKYPRRSHRDWCWHGPHDIPCGYRYVETVSDTVGFFRPPTGIVRDILIAVCRCRGSHD